MTKLELAQRTKAKYPQYKDIDDNELAERILAKYPVYRSQITEQPQQTALQKMTSNIKTKVSSRVSDLGQDIKSAKDTPGSIQGSRAALRVGGAVAGSLNDILFEGLKAVTPDKVEQLAKAGISKVMSTEPAQYVAEKISAWAERNPESAKDLQDVLEISSAIPAIKGAQAATKTTIKAGKMATTAVKKALGKTLTTAGAVAEKGGKAVVAATYPPTASQARGLVAYKAKTPLLKRVSDSAAGISKAPTTPADVAVKYGLVGIRRSDIGAKAKRISNQLFENQVKPVVEGIKKRVKTATLFDEVKTQINKTADISKKKSLLNALDSLKDDYKGVSSLSYKQLDKIKSEMAKGLPAKVWKGQDIAGDINNVRKIFSDKARAIIRKELPDSVKTVYDEYGSLMSIVEKGEKSLQRGLDSGVLGLTSEAIRTAGTPITTIGGKTISDIGTGVKKFGQKLLKTKPLPKGKGEILKSSKLSSNYLGNSYFDNGNKIVGSKTILDTPEIVKVRSEQAGQVSTHLINTPERVAIRSSLADKLYGNGAIKKDKIADIVIGPPASGKSSVFVSHLKNKNGALEIDSDIVKEWLPEFNKGRYAGVVHQESSDITDKVLLKAIQNNDNVVLPLVGKNSDRVEELARILKEQGYKVNLYLNELSPEKAAQRAVTRFNETGRFVDPLYIIDGVGNKPVQTFQKLKNNKLIDYYEHFSNDVKKGKKPKVIEKKK